MKEYIIQKLINQYPNKIIENFASNNSSLYQITSRYARENSIDLNYFLETNGFIYKKKTRTIGSKFDYLTALKLINDFGVTQQEMADWFKITRQAINDKLQRKVQTISWIAKDLNSLEEDIVENMIEQQVIHYEEEELIVSIKTNYIIPCIILVTSSGVKVFFDLKEQLISKLSENNFTTFREKDFQFKEYMTPVLVLGLEKARIDKNFIQQVYTYCRKRNLTLDDYCKIHGYKDGYCDHRTITDQELIEIINTYIVEDNLVFFPVNSPHYYNFTNRASRANMVLEELFEFLGYIKIESRLNSNYEAKIQKYINELREYVIAENSNKVIIKSDSLLYQKLYSFSKRRNISLDDFLRELGFERIYNKQSDFLKSSNIHYYTDISDIKNKLKEIEKIQGRLECSLTINEKISRNQSLVSKLKQLYNYECQLCTKESVIPIIKKDDGSYYVEVHHIIALNNITKESILGFDDELDTYKNAIVVCPFHHKVLHYHDGGFQRLIRQDRELYFVSNQDTLLKINKNYHLDNNFF